MNKGTALIIGVGDGLSASLARKLSDEGYDLILAAREPHKISELAAELSASSHSCDASIPAQVDRLFEAVTGPLRVMIYNPSARVRGPLTDLNPEDVHKAIDVTAFGAFLTGQQAARRMQDQEFVNGKRGTILFTGASAGVKGVSPIGIIRNGKICSTRSCAIHVERIASKRHPRGVDQH